MNISLIFKNGEPSLAKNYRPISVLPCVLKMFERIIQKQLLRYIDTFSSSSIYGFSSQTALPYLVEKWKAALDNKCFAGWILMDFLKASDTVNHKLLIGKLHAYAFNKYAYWNYFGVT